MIENPIENKEKISGDFNSIIANIKEESMDVNEIKEMIIMIKRNLDSIIQNCRDELTETEILEQFIEEYDNEISFRGDIMETLLSRIVTYRGYRDLLKLYRTDKHGFRNMIKEIKAKGEKESQDFFSAETRSTLEENIGKNNIASKIARRLTALSSSNNKMKLNLHSNKNMMAVLNNVLNEFIKRGRDPVEEKVIEYIQGAKSIMEDVVGDHLIYIIHESIAWLDEYGVLDNSINKSNEELSKLGLERLNIKKRNPVSEEYDKKGKRLRKKENSEDVGLIDSYNIQNLKDPEKYSPEDLLIMASFWELQYWIARMQQSQAIATIESLDLWEDLMKKDESAILYLDDEKIKNALKRDKALKAIVRTGVEITPQIREQHKKFLEISGFDVCEIEEDIARTVPETDNLVNTITDVSLMECLILQQLKEKNPKIKKWGIAKEEIEKESIFSNTDSEKEVIIKVIIEHEELKGPLILRIPEGYLKGFFNVENLDDLPEYTDADKLDETYYRVTENTVLPVLPVNAFFKKVAVEEYKKDPTSYIKASLSGKPVKKIPGQQNGGQLGGEER